MHAKIIIINRLNFENMAVKLSDFEKNETSPFAQQTLMKLGECVVAKPVKSTNADESAVARVIDGSGGLIGQSAFFTTKVLDEENFTKFYLAGFSAFYGLKPSALKVFNYIMSLLKPNRDDFILFVSDCSKATGIGVATVYRALGELCAAEIIARGRFEEQFFINPVVCFNGSRVTFATTYINENHPEYQTNQRGLTSTIQQMQDEGVLSMEKRQLKLDFDNVEEDIEEYCPTPEEEEKLRRYSLQMNTMGKIFGDK